MTLVINEREYDVPELDFNAVCDLADRGIDILNTNTMQKNALGTARGFCAWVMGVDTATAGREIQQHILNGGDIATIIDAFTKAVEESGFFNAISNRMPAPQDHKRKVRKAQEE